jgi:hypothetical protein
LYLAAALNVPHGAKLALMITGWLAIYLNTHAIAHVAVGRLVGIRFRAYRPDPETLAQWRRPSQASTSKGSAMSEISAGHHGGPGRYEIRLKGHLDSRWAA